MQRLVIQDKAGIKAKIQSYFERNEEARFIHRLHGVLLFSEKEDESCDSIGALFGNSPRTVSNWIKRVNETGNIESLRSKKQPGRPSRLSEEQRQELRVIIQDPPENHGINSNIWDGKSLSAFIGDCRANHCYKHICFLLKVLIDTLLSAGFFWTFLVFKTSFRLFFC